MLSRFVLIPVLIIAQLGSAAYGRSVFVWCLGPHGELKLELPHESCQHDCAEEAPARRVIDTHEDAYAHTHDCDDIPADLTDPAVRRAAPGAAVASTSDAPTAAAGTGVTSRHRVPYPHSIRARGGVDRPPPTLRVLRTVRMLV